MGLSKISYTRKSPAGITVDYGYWAYQFGTAGEATLACYVIQRHSGTWNAFNGPGSTVAARSRTKVAERYFENERARIVAVLARLGATP